MLSKDAKLLKPTAIAILLMGLIPMVVLAGHPVSTPVLIFDEPHNEKNPAVAFNSKWREYLVVFWNDRPGNDDIRAERIGTVGRRLGGRWVAAGPGADRRYPDVAYNPDRNEYLVAWNEFDGSGNVLLNVQRLAADARPIGQVETLTAGPVSVIEPMKPAVAYASTSQKYLVVWEHFVNMPPAPQATSIVGHVVSNMGQPEGSPVNISVDPGGQARRLPRLAYDRSGNGYLVVWQQYDAGILGHNIYGRLVHGAGGITSGPIEIAKGSNDKTDADVASIPTGASAYKYLVVWSRSLSGDTHILGRLVKGNGSLAPSHIIVADSEPVLLQPRVAASESAQRYLVVWLTNRSLLPRPPRGREVSSTGVLMGDEYDFPRPWADEPAVASGSSGTFLAAWQDRDAGGADDNILGHFWGNRVYLPLVIR